MSKNLVLNNGNGEPNVAVYWDFENIHASVCTLKFGDDWYREFRHLRQPAAVNIDDVMDYLASLGEVNINKAYANWSRLFNYSFMLQNHAIDLIQLFPKGKNAKNGADIRMAVDVIDDLNNNPHIGLVVIIGGDSDYISIAQRVRQKGRRVLGIGVKDTSNQYWVKSCNQFRFYSAIISEQAENGSAAACLDRGELEEAKKVLCKAVAKLGGKSGQNYALLPNIQPFMVRLDPSFDERDLGFESFQEFLGACGDCIDIEEVDGETRVSVTDECPYGEVEEPALGMVAGYRAILEDQGLKLPEPALLLSGLRFVVESFAEKPDGLDNLRELVDSLDQRFEESGLAHGLSDCFAIKQLVYRSYGFRFDHEHNKRFLQEENSTTESLTAKVLRTVLRALDKVDSEPLDLGAVSEIVYGDPDHADELKALWEEPAAA